MKLSKKEIKMIKEGKHPFYYYNPKPIIWKKRWKKIER